MNYTAHNATNQLHKKKSTDTKCVTTATGKHAQNADNHFAITTIHKENDTKMSNLEKAYTEVIADIIHDIGWDLQAKSDIIDVLENRLWEITNLFDDNKGMEE
jgi:carboxypeptidase C (cathepsin A)